MKQENNPQSAIRNPESISRFAFKLWQEWKRLSLPEKNACVVVAVSGGADSVALFLALHELTQAEKLSLHLIVAHFNHGLRQEAKSDADWVENLIEKFKIQNSEFKIQEAKTKDRKPKTEIEFVSGEGDVPAQAKETKDNLEQAARRARYGFLFDVAVQKEASIIVTAHTMDDQAETVLLRLLRGSGAEGLGGIESVSRFKIQDSKFKIQNSKTATDKKNPLVPICNPQSKNLQSAGPNPLLVRPLLNWSRRDDTEHFCRQNGIDFLTDAMNEDGRFARVRVRKELLPIMESFNGRIVETLARTASILREDAAELNNQAEKLLIEASIDNKHESAHLSLSVNVLAQASAGLRRRALRLWIEKAKGDLRRLETAHILQVESLLKGEQGGRFILLPGGFRIERRKSFLNFILPKG